MKHKIVRGEECVELIDYVNLDDKAMKTEKNEQGYEFFVFLQRGGRCPEGTGG